MVANLKKIVGKRIHQTVAIDLHRHSYRPTVKPCHICSVYQNDYYVTTYHRSGHYETTGGVCPSVCLSRASI